MVVEAAQAEYIGAQSQKTIMVNDDLAVPSREKSEPAHEAS
jgi:hypothetical protein